jgi:hypothetical protein
MPHKILLFRPKIPVSRRNYPPPGKSQQKARNIRISAYLPGSDDIIIIGHPHHALVERPMAKLAQRHAVTYVVVLAHAPRNDVSGIDNGMSF